MANGGTQMLTEHLDDLADPRIERSKRHTLMDILTIPTCAAITGADSGGQ